MIQEISVEELADLPECVLLDVRSEGEFEEATIPGAVNLPLLNNSERAEVGKAYTNVSPSAAREMGLRFVSPKLPELAAQAGKLGHGRPLVLFCWRGGMRSRALAQIFDLMGLPVYRLVGGYKAYRHKVVEFFAQKFQTQVLVLRGNTGVGKTELLDRLRRSGYPAIDLEGLAKNRGSVFGDVGLGKAPSQKAFEACFYEDLRLFRDRRYVIVECESKRIGRVNLPLSFYEAMQNGIQILVYDGLKSRVKRLVEEYTRFPGALEQIWEALQRLRKTLGNLKVDELERLIREDQEEFTRILLQEYYDPLYAYPNEPSHEYSLSLNQANPVDAMKELERYLAEYLAATKSGSAVSGV